MSTPLSCPYCNALVPAPAGVQAGQMITCPRCDDRFRVLADAVPAATDTSPPPAAAPIVPPIFRRSNRVVAMVVLGVMVVMAMSGLTLALLTQGKRREHDKGIPGRAKRPRQLEVEVPQKVAPTAPLDLTALRYLPADCDVLLGIHMAEVLQEPAGRELLNLELPGLGTVEQSVLQKVERLTGLAMLDVGHLVLAARVNHKVIPPRLLIVVRTRAPYDQGRVCDRLRATTHPQAAGRPLYRFQQELLPLYDTGVLACPDEQTLVLGWQVLDLADMTVS